jgi:hypothetical protein
MMATKSKDMLSASEKAAISSLLGRHWVTILSVLGGLVGAKVILDSARLNLSAGLWLLLAGLLWVARWQTELLWWVNARRRLLAKHSTPAPPFWQMAKELRQRRKRIAYVRDQWAAFCAENQLTGFGKAVPKLGWIKSNVDLDLVAHIAPGPLGVTGGMAPFRKKAADIAVTCGCPGGVRFRETSIGKGTVTFMWSDLLERELPVAEMPQGAYGRAGYGITDGREGMSIRLSLSAFVIGMSGSGKSKIIRDVIIDLKRKKVTTHLYPIDPKRQEFARLGALKGQTLGSLTVKDYAKTPEDAARMLERLVDIMHARQDEMGAQDIDQWEEKHAGKWPLVLIPVDEVFELMEMWKPDPKTKVHPKAFLTTLLSQGRASGFQVIMGSQVAHKEILGMTRSLVPQRVVLHMESALEVGMAFGDNGAEDKGVKCSQVQEPGMGWQWVEGEGYMPFRSALPSADDWTRTLTGDLLPEGMLEKGAAIAEPYFNYRFYTSDRQPLRTGITNNFERRYKEYRRDYEDERDRIAAGLLDPAKALHQWFPFHDHTKTVVTEAKDKADAKKIESALIATGVWRGNHQENENASLRNIAPPPPDGRHWWQGKPKPQPETPTNVTPINRRRPTDPERIERRRRA